MASHDGDLLAVAGSEAAITQSDIVSEPDPDNTCIICLQSIADRTVLPCAHDEFCFECMLMWTNQSRRCPLCSGEIKSYLIHQIRSDKDYQKYYLQALRLTPPPSFAPLQARVAAQVRQRRRPIQWGTAPHREGPDELEEAVEKRRWVYRNKVFAKHVASNSYTKFRPYPTPAQFAASEVLVKKATMFIRRELRVWVNLDVEFLTTFILSLLRTLDIRSEPAVRGIAEFLDLGGEKYHPGDAVDNAEHFIHEVYSFLRSPYSDLGIYDSVVQYDLSYETRTGSGGRLRPVRPDDVDLLPADRKDYGRRRDLFSTLPPGPSLQVHNIHVADTRDKELSGSQREVHRKQSREPSPLRERYHHQRRPDETNLRSRARSPRRRSFYLNKSSPTDSPRHQIRGDRDYFPSRASHDRKGKAKENGERAKNNEQSLSSYSGLSGGGRGRLRQSASPPALSPSLSPSSSLLDIRDPCHKSELAEKSNHSKTTYAHNEDSAESVLDKIAPNGYGADSAPPPPELLSIRNAASRLNPGPVSADSPLSETTESSSHDPGIMDIGSEPPTPLFPIATFNSPLTAPVNEETESSLRSAYTFESEESDFFHQRLLARRTSAILAPTSSSTPSSGDGEVTSATISASPSSSITVQFATSSTSQASTSTKSAHQTNFDGDTRLRLLRARLNAAKELKMKQTSVISPLQTSEPDDSRALFQMTAGEVAVQRLGDASPRESADDDPNNWSELNGVDSSAGDSTGGDTKNTREGLEADASTLKQILLRRRNTGVSRG